MIVMKQIILKHTHPFFDDIDQLISESPVKNSNYSEKINWLIENHGYFIESPNHGIYGAVSMTEPAYTMFLIKYGKEPKI